MKIEIDNNIEGYNKIEAYSSGQVVIANNLYRTNLIVSPTTIIDDWQPRDIFELTPEHLQAIISLAPEIVLLGTGKQTEFPPDAVFTSLFTRQIGYEVMDTGAACRSYNFLVEEGRQVVAALFLIR